MSVNKAVERISVRVKKAAIFLIWIYKKAVSPFLGRSCRFYPSCSQYAEEAIERYGVVAGSQKALWRVLRCNPFSRGGFDPVATEENIKEEI